MNNLSNLFFLSVGALTSKPYSFSGRPWESRTIKSLDLFDAMGSNINIDTRGSTVLKIVPFLNDCFNESWITDKIRFSYDSFKNQRLSVPLLKDYNSNIFIPLNWKQAFNKIKYKLNINNLICNSNVFGLAGNMVDAESLTIFKFLINCLGGKAQTNVDKSIFQIDFRSQYTFSNNLNYSNNTDMCLLVGCYPRYEAPILNVRLRRNVIKNNLIVFLTGFSNSFTYPIVKLGQGNNPVIQLLEGRSILTKFWKKSTNSFLVLGLNNLQRKDGNSFINIFSLFLSKFKPTNINILNVSASRLMGAELGLECKSINSNGIYNNNNFIYLLDVDEINVNKSNSTFIIYQGHHGDKMAYEADIILPGSLPYEKKGSYINLDGLVQKTNPIYNPPKEAKNDWRILVALYCYIFQVDIEFENFLLSKIHKISPFEKIFNLSFKKASLFESIKILDNKLNLFRLVSSPSQRYMEDFYVNNSLTRSSSMMVLASRRFNVINLNFQ